MTLPAAAAAAQVLDPLAAHRSQMEQVRARTELQGIAASVHSLQTAQARQQFHDVVGAGRAVPYPAELAQTPASSPRCIDTRLRRVVACPPLKPAAKPPARAR
jgi:hypothetical protein